MLVLLPRQQIQLLVDTYDQISIVTIDDIMFFRPVSQAVVKGYEDSSALDIDSCLLYTSVSALRLLIDGKMGM